jgi:hypothetical protein
LNFRRTLDIGNSRRHAMEAAGVKTKIGGFSKLLMLRDF